MSANFTQFDRCVGFAVVASGLLQCFFGHRVIKISVGLSCFFGAFALVHFASEIVSLSRDTAVYIGVLMGLVSVWVVQHLYRTGVFFVGAVAGMLLTRSIASLLAISSFGLLIESGIALLSGTIALRLEGAALALSSSVAGGGLIAYGIATVRQGTLDFSQLSVGDIVVGFAFSVFGFIKQKK